MAVGKKALLDLETWRPELERAGWDVSLGDVLTAYRGDAFGHWQLSVDKGGRVHLRRSTLARQPRSRSLEKGNHVYHLHEEHLALYDAATTIDAADDLSQALQTMMTLLLSPPDLK